MKMAMSIRNARAEALAREAARKSGTTMTEAIIRALEDYVAKLRGRHAANDLVKDILAIGKRCAAYPTLDTRSEDAILGYGPDGTLERKRRRGR